MSTVVMTTLNLAQAERRLCMIALERANAISGAPELLALLAGFVWLIVWLIVLMAT